MSTGVDWLKIMQSAVSPWLLFGSWLIFAVLVLPTGIEFFVPTFIVAVISSVICANLSLRVRKNPNIAYAIGFFFGVLGLLGYWIYYKIISKN